MSSTLAEGCRGRLWSVLGKTHTTLARPLFSCPERAVRQLAAEVGFAATAPTRRQAPAGTDNMTGGLPEASGLVRAGLLDQGDFKALQSLAPETEQRGTHLLSYCPLMIEPAAQQQL